MMRIFVAGATGALGTRLLPMLVQRGHAVSGLTHRPANASVIEAMGATPFVADGLAREAVLRAVHEAQPDIVVHQMTALKNASDLRAFDKAFALSNRLRTEGTDHLLAAAREVGVSRFVAQSFCGWPYARSGGRVKSESEPLDPDPAPQFRRTLAAIRHLEATVTTSLRPQGIVLRYGGFYGEDTGVFDGALLDQVRRRRAPVIGDGKGYWSFIEIGDAARATVLAIENGTPGAIYNIVDDEPAPVRVWLPALAEMLGAPPPLRVPAWIGRVLAGAHTVAMMTEIRAGSNEKAKRELGWQPAFPSWRDGFAAVLAASGRRT